MFSDSLVLKELVELPTTDFKCFENGGKRFTGFGSTTDIVHVCGKMKCVLSKQKKQVNLILIAGIK